MQLLARDTDKNNVRKRSQAGQAFVRGEGRDPRTLILFQHAIQVKERDFNIYNEIIINA